MVEPRIKLVPTCVSRELGNEAVEFCASVGLELDDWQAMVLRDAHGVDEEGRWAAFEVGVNVSRQNGKGGILNVVNDTGGSSTIANPDVPVTVVDYP